MNTNLIRIQVGNEISLAEKILRLDPFQYDLTDPPVPLPIPRRVFQVRH